MKKRIGLVLFVAACGSDGMMTGGDDGGGGDDVIDPPGMADPDGRDQVGVPFTKPCSYQHGLLGMVRVSVDPLDRTG